MYIYLDIQMMAKKVNFFSLKAQSQVQTKEVGHVSRQVKHSPRATESWSGLLLELVAENE